MRLLGAVIATVIRKWKGRGVHRNPRASQPAAATVAASAAPAATTTGEAPTQILSALVDREAPVSAKTVASSDAKAPWTVQLP